MQLRVVVSNVSSIVRFDVRFVLLRDAPCVVMNDRGFDGGAVTLGGATMSSCAAVGTSLGKRRESSVDATETTDGDRGGNTACVSKALLLLPETTPRPASGVRKYGSTISAVAIVVLSASLCGDLLVLESFVSAIIVVVPMLDLAFEIDFCSQPDGSFSYFSSSLITPVFIVSGTISDVGVTSYSGCCDYLLFFTKISFRRLF